MRLICSLISIVFISKTYHKSTNLHCQQMLNTERSLCCEDDSPFSELVLNSFYHFANIAQQVMNFGESPKRFRRCVSFVHIVELPKRTKINSVLITQVTEEAAKKKTRVSFLSTSPLRSPHHSKA